MGACRNRPWSSASSDCRAQGARPCVRLCALVISSHSEFMHAWEHCQADEGSYSTCATCCTACCTCMLAGNSRALQKAALKLVPSATACFPIEEHMRLQDTTVGLRIHAVLCTGSSTRWQKLHANVPLIAGGYAAIVTPSTCLLLCSCCSCWNDAAWFAGLAADGQGPCAA
jgi:hypothetical protein